MIILINYDHDPGLSGLMILTINIMINHMILIGHHDDLINHDDHDGDLIKIMMIIMVKKI